MTTDLNCYCSNGYTCLGCTTSSALATLVEGDGGIDLEIPSAAEDEAHKEADRAEREAAVAEREARYQREKRDARDRARYQADRAGARMLLAAMAERDDNGTESDVVVTERFARELDALARLASEQAALLRLNARHLRKIKGLTS